jgi:lysophospholipase L1-like esterase
LFNTVLLIIVINLILGIVFFFRDHLMAQKGDSETTQAEIDPTSQGLFYIDGKPVDNGKRTTYQLRWVDYTAYERVADAPYVGSVLDDFFHLAKLGFIYQPWVQFSEPLYHGKLVNVELDSQGFPIRRTLNPPQGQVATARIFVLGGSTTFGYNVADEHTWPSYLAQIFNERVQAAHLPVQVQVTNYGRGFYDTSQETVLLIDLLKSGLRPHLVIFMDGINWGPEQDVPHFTSKFATEFRELQSPTLTYLSWIPMARLVSTLSNRLFSKAQINASNMQSPEHTDENQYVQYAVNRFVQNRMIARRICEQYAVKVLFFLQPDPIHNYSLPLYRISLGDWFLQDRHAHQQFYTRLKHTEGVIDLSNLFEVWGPNRKAIVDDVHYSPGFNHFLAQQVADYIDVASLLTASQPVDTARSTGSLRHNLYLAHQ